MVFDKSILIKNIEKEIKISIENINIINNINFCKFVEIISFKLSAGKKPPFETNVIVKFRELNSLT